MNIQPAHHWALHAILLAVIGWLKDKHDKLKEDHMSLEGDVKLAITFVPQLEKIVADAKAVEGVPQNVQLITDLEALVTSIKAAA